MNMNNISKLLIVDDKPENLRALEAIIRSDGRQIFQANSGDQALALLLEHDFAMAILSCANAGDEWL